MKKLLSFLAVMFFLAGCGSSGYDGNKESFAVTDSITNNYGSYFESASGTDVIKDGDTQFEQKIITNGSLEIETKNFDETMMVITDAIKGLNGYIQSSDIRKYTHYTGDGEYRNATIIIRIPAENLETFLTHTESAGNIVSSKLDSEDITTQYYDLVADIEALEAQEDRLIELYKKAETISDLITIEQRLSSIRNQINKAKMTLENYDLLTTYSTVTIQIEEVEILTEKSDSFFSIISNAFDESILNFKDFIMEAIIALIHILPFLAFYGLISIGIAILIKKTNHKNTKKIHKPNNIVDDKEKQA